MNQTPHSLILASAGTGKTYRLSNRFLALLFQGVEPERILATTFTRKAAGEILDRVLERLMLAAESEAGRAELAEALEQPQLTQKHCLDLLCRTTRRMDAFQVRTIDSFFVHLAKLFALDLALPPGWQITDDRVDERVRSEALQGFLAEESKETLAVLIREITKGKAARGIHHALLAHVTALRGVFLEAEEDSWDSFSTGVDATDAEYERACLALDTAELPLTKTGKPNTNWVKARDKFLLLTRNGSWEALVDSGIGNKLLTGQSYHNIEFPESLAEAMGPILQRASHQVLEQLRARNLAAETFLRTFENAYAGKKREQGTYGFADLPYAFAPRTAKTLPLDDRELDMWFRMDGRIDHLLLDEFQDTSPVQWRILAPIAEQITAEGDGERSFFCVGDVKQSIYAFRQAEPRLLRNLHSLLPALDPSSIERMNKSYRSSQAVLDAVNFVFEGLTKSAHFQTSEFQPHLKACEEFVGDFESHEAAKPIPGVVNLVQWRAGEDKSALWMERIVERVVDMLSDAPAATVGILMRTRKHIPKIINQLSQAGIEASGEGGNVLTDARSVLVFLSVLHLADFPDDSAAAFHIAESPFAGFLKINGKPSDRERRKLSRTLRHALAKDGLASFVSDYASQVLEDSAWSEWDRARFAQLLDLAYAFESGRETRPSAFIDHVRKHGVEVPGGARVRVMTIHASKGLEFDAVLLPQLDSKFVSMPEKVWVHRPRAEKRIEGASLSVRSPLLPVSIQLGELKDQQVTRSMGDDLCVLYVAMTRAARRLDMIVPPPVAKKSETIPTIADQLRLSFEDISEEPEDDGVVWSHRCGANWYDGLLNDETPAPAPTAKSIPLSFAPEEEPRNFSRRSASAEEGAGMRRAADALRSSRAAEFGTLVHGMLETLEWAEGFDPDAAVHCSAALLGRPEDVSQAQLLLGKAFGSAEICEALSESGCGAPAGTELEVQNEARFSLVRGDALWNGAIDRLVLGRSGGEVVWAQIIDFKTDSPEPDGIEALVQHYRPQLQCYAEVIGELHDLPPEALRVQLVFLRAGRVCTLS